MYMYSILDKVAQEFGPLFGAKNDEVAKRQFSNFMKGDRVIYADDYELRCICDFDTETGTVQTENARVVLSPKSEAVQMTPADGEVDDEKRKFFSIFNRRKEA